MLEQENTMVRFYTDSRSLTTNLLKVCACALLLTACSTGNKNYVTSISPVKNTQQVVKKRIGLLLPLTGRNGGLGNNMLKAAQLAVTDPAQLDVHDTVQGGGASEAARQAIGAGDGIILGPLTGADTLKVASVTAPANIPVISYSSKSSLAGPNLWVFGITQDQQILAMVQAAKNEGRTKFAAFLPDNDFGHAMADGLIKACSDLGLMQPQIVYHMASSEDIVQKLKTLSAFDARVEAAKHGSAPSQGQAGPVKENDDSLQNELIPSTSGKPDAGSQSVPLDKPPFDALLLADTGLQLQSVINAMQETQVSTDKVRVMGPTLWSAFVNKLGKLKGAWYTAPDPIKRQEFVREYMSRYGQPPKPLADFSYDSAALANSLSQQPGGYSEENLTRSSGFNGVDGFFALQPGGQVKRDLQIFEIQPMGGGKMISAPSSHHGS